MMGLLVLAGFLGVIVAIGWSFWLVMGRIHRRGRAVGVSPTGALVLGYFGYLAGTITSVFAAGSLLEVAFDGDPPGVLIAPTLIVSSVVGAVVGSGIGYVVLWARTTRDPDYEPPDWGPAGDDLTTRRGR